MKSRNPGRHESDADRLLRHMLNCSPDFSRGETRVTFEVGRSLLIEGVRSVCEYTEERLVISTYSRRVVIEGCGLCICRMMEDAMVICGRIDTVRFD
ncbi:MAG: YabP/YqfC family sporulation protein [Clostridia bacterium]|nr:YabP/YqfC family sporulation protein [Clostridia bacterium]